MKEAGIELFGEQLVGNKYGGESEIRTHERVAPLPVFKTGAFNRSAISPFLWLCYTFKYIKVKI